MQLAIRSALVLAILTVSACGASPAGHAGGPATGAPSAAIPSPKATALPVGVLASIPVDAGSAPAAIGAGFGSVWVSSHRGDTLYRIDPATNQVIARINIGQETCGAISFAASRVWVGPCDTAQNSIAVDPSTNQVACSVAGHAGPVAGADIWLSTNTGTFEQADATTCSIKRTPAVHGVITAAGGGAIWAVDADFSNGDFSGVVTKADATTGRVLARFNVARIGSYPWATYAFGAVWLKAVDTPELLRIDPNTGTTRSYQVDKWMHLSQYFDNIVTADETSLYLRTSDSTVSQINPATGATTATYPADAAGGGGQQLAAFGSLWICNFASDTVWRDKLP